MTSPQASRVVLISGAGMAIFVLIHAHQKGQPFEKTYKSLWAVGAVTLGLSVFADFAPEVAGPFALLVLIAMAVRNSGALGSVIGGAAGTPKASVRVASGGNLYVGGASGPPQIHLHLKGAK